MLSPGNLPLTEDMYGHVLRQRQEPPGPPRGVIAASQNKAMPLLTANAIEE